jgi:hypothetical protein
VFFVTAGIACPSDTGGFRFRNGLHHSPLVITGVPAAIASKIIMPKPS